MRLIKIDHLYVYSMVPSNYFVAKIKGILLVATHEGLMRCYPSDIKLYY